MFMTKPDAVRYRIVLLVSDFAVKTSIIAEAQSQRLTIYSKRVGASRKVGAS